MSSQVSSVGFNNLKKSNTNTSVSSNASLSTIKTNPLTRLFTKNRSVTNLATDDDVSTIDTQSSKFRKKRLFNKTPPPSPAKPQLTIQTGGHHGLKVSKKILSSKIDENAARKNSISSPASTFHNLFHRGSAPPETIPNKEDLMNSRTTLTLSSNNSNSYIADVNFALLYNFTNPDYDDNETTGNVNTSNNNSFLDIHKKLLVPTDQYLNKLLHKSQMTNEIGLGITNEREESGPAFKADFAPENLKFYTHLLNLTRPLFMPSQQKLLSNGMRHPYLGVSVEDIAIFIKDNYAYETSAQSKSKQGKFHRVNSLSSLEATAFISSSEKFDDFKIREISQDLLTYCVKSMAILQKDFVDDSKPPSAFKMWSNLSRVWAYFNQKIRFYVLCMFQPLQKYLREVSIQNHNNSSPNYKNIDLEIDNTLLLAFRDILIIPALIQRKKAYEELTSKNGAYLEVLSEEENYLKSDKKLLDGVINCFGDILSYVHKDGNSDGEQQFRKELLDSGFQWLIDVKSRGEEDFS